MESFITTWLGFSSDALADVPGFDISHFQASVDFASAYRTTYKDPSFSNYHNGATSAGLIPGGYHFAHPETSLRNTYHRKIRRSPLLYTNPSWWWSNCTGGSSAFINTNPLVLARYSSTAGTPPGCWPCYTIWQFNNAYQHGGDSDTFNGDVTGLKKLATA
ncbi:glycoside hydrolase family 25 protein [Hypoxylon sp. FL1150]|nr:glycoside hydrolase family 25 protein [Hypoxylon sp. FL1150]